MAADTINIPQPPREEEQLGYYYGLPSRPKLVARSSTDPYKYNFDFSTQYPVGKLLSSVRQHPIADLWNTDGPLRREIVLALDGIQWTVIDVLRLGYQPRMTEELQLNHPVTLLISVKKDSTPWEQGHSVVVRCHEILQNYGISDVHCEMKESHTIRLASPPAAPLSAPKLHSEYAQTYPGRSTTCEVECEKIHAVLSAYLGHSIATFDQPTREGTKCLYLRRKDTGQVLLLICRHALFNGTSANEDYIYDESNAESMVTILQPGDDTLARRKKDIALCIKCVDFHIESIKRLDELTQDEKKARIAEELATLPRLEAAAGRLEDVSPPATRIIGHVLFSPKFGTSTRTTGQSSSQRVRDWALIELHPGKHASPLEELENEVSVTEKERLNLLCAHEVEGFTFHRHLSFHYLRNTLPLVGMVSEAETKGGEHESRLPEEPAILVGKRGQRSKLTYGLANNVTSLMREVVDNIEFVSEEWCILGPKPCGWMTDRRHCFCGLGDSGSCIWDLQSRVGGMLTSASGDPTYGGIDTAYATPMEWLLEDMRAYGYDVEILDGERPDSDIGQAD
ncbi:hypothetical protein EDB81DRAFT_764100 [Dactylonectria macrodidyma]|uniref:Uncharacterized protein n=1 Tax=Dactylonectria macrodidyma TaxID=307937 RepID=A0A9P9DYT3_9HYPO|nr:hypothetical protein EDB81DRAFT_764100 [Dactylonectria macrodidyma]